MSTNAEYEAKERARLTELLTGYCEHVPPSVNSGSYNNAVAFKADIVKCRKVISKRNVSNNELRSAINTLDRYWREAPNVQGNS